MGRRTAHPAWFFAVGFLVDAGRDWPGLFCEEHSDHCDPAIAGCIIIFYSAKSLAGIGLGIFSCSFRSWIGSRSFVG